MPGIALVALLVGVTAGTAFPASAQILEGRVLDGTTRAPVAEARTSLVDADGVEVSEPSRTGSDGRFSLSAPGAGAYYIKVERESYTPIVDGVFEFAAANGRMSLEVFMLPRPVAVSGVDVRINQEQARRRLRATGFYQRAVEGFGTFVTPEQIETLGLRPNVSDYLRSVPGIMLHQGLVLFRDAAGGRFLSGSDGSPIDGCFPNVWIDGSQTLKAQDRQTLQLSGGQLDTSLSEGDPAQGIDDLIQPQDVIAIEVYRTPASTPIEWGGLNGSCGTIVIWTKTGG